MYVSKITNVREVRLKNNI